MVHNVFTCCRQILWSGCTWWFILKIESCKQVLEMHLMDIHRTWHCATVTQRRKLHANWLPWRCQKSCHCLLEPDRFSTQHEVINCSMFVFIATWLHSNTLDTAIELQGPTLRCSNSVFGSKYFHWGSSCSFTSPLSLPTPLLLENLVRFCVSGAKFRKSRNRVLSWHGEWDVETHSTPWHLWDCSRPAHMSALTYDSLWPVHNKLNLLNLFKLKTWSEQCREGTTGGYPVKWPFLKIESNHKLLWKWSLNFWLRVRGNNWAALQVLGKMTCSSQGVYTHILALWRAWPHTSLEILTVPSTKPGYRANVTHDHDLDIIFDTGCWCVIVLLIDCVFLKAINNDNDVIWRLDSWLNVARMFHSLIPLDPLTKFF